MDKQSSTPPTAPQEPVAYDREGRPLYAAPVSTGGGAQPESHTVYTQRAVAHEGSEEVQRKHDEAAKRYPSLDLTDVEYVVDEVRRSNIGMLAPGAISIFIVALIVSVLISFPGMTNALGFDGTGAYLLVLLVGVLLIVLIGGSGYLAAWTYARNRLFLTNESVIQEIQTGLFSRRGQKASLGDIEDVSYRQEGIMQYLFNYGSIRLSTPGDETTYRFNYVDNPKEQVARINNAVADFKSGRPVSP